MKRYVHSNNSYTIRKTMFSAFICLDRQNRLKDGIYGSSNSPFFIDASQSIHELRGEFDELQLLSFKRF